VRSEDYQSEREKRQEFVKMSELPLSLLPCKKVEEKVMLMMMVFPNKPCLHLYLDAWSYRKPPSVCGSSSRIKDLT
jgi:hypothetical protein